MAWKRLRGNSNSILSGARLRKSLRLLAQNWFSLRAAGAASGGCSTPLLPRPRSARMPFQATSGWSDRCVKCGGGLRSNFFFASQPTVKRRVCRKIQFLTSYCHKYKINSRGISYYPKKSSMKTKSDHSCVFKNP
jgi:hypothetical protein